MPQSAEIYDIASTGNRSRDPLTQESLSQRGAGKSSTPELVKKKPRMDHFGSLALPPSPASS